MNRYFIKLECDGRWTGSYNDSASINIEDVANIQFRDWIDKNVYHTVQLWKRCPDGKEILLKEHISKTAILIGGIIEYNRRQNIIYHIIGSEK